MTKRDQGRFRRNKRDFYRTPPEAVRRLTPFLTDHVFAEPMCGDGAIVDALTDLGWTCNWASDVSPKFRNAVTMDVLNLDRSHLMECGQIVTNPPWPRHGASGSPTIEYIEHMMRLRPTWVLLSADFAHCGYARDVLPYCAWIVSVGRVSWMGNNVSGFDNAAWYHFHEDDRGPARKGPIFINREPEVRYHRKLAGGII